VVRAANEDHLPCAGKSRGVPLKLVEFVGSVARLAWAKSNGCPWRVVTGARGLTTGVTVCTFIAKGGSVEALRWARERGCPWTVTTCAWAAMGGHLAGPGACCPPRHPMQLDRSLLSQFKRSSMVKRVSCFTRPQHLEVLKWAREHGCPWDATTCKHAANGGHLEMLQWARERDCPWDAQTCSWAAIGGHLEVGPGRYCPTGARADAWCLLIRADASLSLVSDTASHVIQRALNPRLLRQMAWRAISTRSYLEVLKWAREAGCPWDSQTCTMAAMWGQPDVMQWAWDHDCPLGGPYSCARAAECGQLEALQWLRGHQCPW